MLRIRLCWQLHFKDGAELGFGFGFGFGFGLGCRNGRWWGLGDAPLYTHAVRPVQLEHVAVDGIDAVLHT